MLERERDHLEDPLTETHPAGPIGALLADRFRIERLVGTGGMAAVYQATDVALGRTVALKLFRGDAAEPERQSGEITVLASLNHFALVTLFDAGTAPVGGMPCTYIVMEFVDGRDLRDRIAASGPLPPADVARIGADLAEALHYVHSKGIIHRDIKPANVLLAPSAFPGRPPQAKLADFGIARLLDATRMTATGNLIGTASYLSPEQAQGTTIGPPSDVYSLGLILLECLTGTRAFPGSAVESAVARLQRQPEIPEQLGAEWIETLRGMTSREPADRFDAGEAAVRLRGLTGTENLPLDAPTKVLPTGSDPSAAATVLLTPGAATGAAPRPSPPSAGDRPAAQPPHAGDAAGSASRRRRLYIALTAAIVTAVTVIVLVLVAAPDGPSAPAPTYPAVEGELGTHLRELQESVNP